MIELADERAGLLGFCVQGPMVGLHREADRHSGLPDVIWLLERGDRSVASRRPCAGSMLRRALDDERTDS